MLLDNYSYNTYLKKEILILYILSIYDSSNYININLSLSLLESACAGWLIVHKNTEGIIATTAENKIAHILPTIVHIQGISQSIIILIFSKTLLLIRSVE